MEKKTVERIFTSEKGTVKVTIPEFTEEWQNRIKQATKEFLTRVEKERAMERQGV